MDVVAWIVRWVELYNPVDAGDIKAASCYVGAQKYSRLCIAKFEEGIRPFLLLLVALSQKYLSFPSKSVQSIRTCKLSTGTSM